MKRILLITESLSSGGAERQLCGLASMLVKAGYQCKLITYIYNQFYEAFLKSNSVDYEYVPQLQNKYLRIFRAAKYVRSYHPDVVISYLPSVNKMMCLAKFFYRSKLIISERNNNISISTSDIILFNIYRKADYIVPNSHSQADFINTNFSFLSSKIHPIINFVDVNRFFPVENNTNNADLKIITVARYTEQKNVLTYLQVIRKVKDSGLRVHFDWYGDKKLYPAYYSQVEHLYNQLQIADYLTLHDSDKEIENRYHEADIFCLPSLYEGYPNVVVEAMSSGLPILCSNCYENPYIVSEGVNGFLFNPNSVDDIFCAIKKMLNLSFSKRKEMGRINRQLCLVRNTRATFLKAYEELIFKL